MFYHLIVFKYIVSYQMNCKYHTKYKVNLWCETLVLRKGVVYTRGFIEKQRMTKRNRTTTWKREGEEKTNELTHYLIENYIE